MGRPDQARLGVRAREVRQVQAQEGRAQEEGRRRSRSLRGKAQEGRAQEEDRRRSRIGRIVGSGRRAQARRARSCGGIRRGSGSRSRGCRTQAGSGSGGCCSCEGSRTRTGSGSRSPGCGTRGSCRPRCSCGACRHGGWLEGPAHGTCPSAAFVQSRSSRSSSSHASGQHLPAHASWDHRWTAPRIRRCGG